MKGSEDYGGVEGSVDGEYAVDIYYSRPPDRVKVFKPFRSIRIYRI